MLCQKTKFPARAGNFSCPKPTTNNLKLKKVIKPDFNKRLCCYCKDSTFFNIKK